MGETPWTRRCLVFGVVCILTTLCDQRLVAESETLAVAVVEVASAARVVIGDEEAYVPGSVRTWVSDVEPEWRELGHAVRLKVPLRDAKRSVLRPVLSEGLYLVEVGLEESYLRSVTRTRLGAKPDVSEVVRLERRGSDTVRNAEALPNVNEGVKLAAKSLRENPSLVLLQGTQALAVAADGETVDFAREAVIDVCFANTTPPYVSTGALEALQTVFGGRVPIWYDPRTGKRRRIVTAFGEYEVDEMQDARFRRLARHVVEAAASAVEHEAKSTKPEADRLRVAARAIAYYGRYACEHVDRETVIRHFTKSVEAADRSGSDQAELRLIVDNVNDVLGQCK